MADLDTSPGDEPPTGDAEADRMPSLDSLGEGLDSLGEGLDSLTSLGSGDATIAGDGPQRYVDESIGQGSVIGRYLILGRLGAGGMGVVYAAYERAVAIYQHHEGVQQYEPAVELDLAKLLVEHGGDRARALELARTAREGLSALGPGQAAKLAELDAWLSELPAQAPDPAGDGGGRTALRWGRGQEP